MPTAILKIIMGYYMPGRLVFKAKDKSKIQTWTENDKYKFVCTETYTE